MSVEIKFEVRDEPKLWELLRQRNFLGNRNNYAAVVAALKEIKAGQIIQIAANRKNASRIQCALAAAFRNNAEKRLATSFDRAKETLYCWTEDRK